MHDALEESDVKPHERIVYVQKIWGSQLQNSGGFFTRKSRPKNLIDKYECCEGIPDLASLQEYRDDGKICTKMYSDPDWFFQIWKDNMLKEAEKNMKKRVKKKKIDHKEREKKTFKTIETTNVRFTFLCIAIPKKNVREDDT